MDRWSVNVDLTRRRSVGEARLPQDTTGIWRGLNHRDQPTARIQLFETVGRLGGETLLVMDIEAGESLSIDMK